MLALPAGGKIGRISSISSRWSPWWSLVACVSATGMIGCRDKGNENYKLLSKLIPEEFIIS